MKHLILYILLFFVVQVSFGQSTGCPLSKLVSEIKKSPDLANAIKKDPSLIDLAKDLDAESIENLTKNINKLGGDVAKRLQKKVNDVGESISRNNFKLTSTSEKYITTEWGNFFKWGKRSEEALAKAKNITSADVTRLKNAGATLEDVKNWEKFYANAIKISINQQSIKLGKIAENANFTAVGRREIMQNLIKIW